MKRRTKLKPLPDANGWGTVLDFLGFAAFIIAILLLYCV